MLLSVPGAAKKKTASFDVSSMIHNRAESSPVTEMSGKRFRETRAKSSSVLGDGGSGTAVDESGRQLMEWWSQKERVKKWRFERASLLIGKSSDMKELRELVHQAINTACNADAVQVLLFSQNSSNSLQYITDSGYEDMPTTGELWNTLRGRTRRVFNISDLLHDAHFCKIMNYSSNDLLDSQIVINPIFGGTPATALGLIMLVCHDPTETENKDVESIVKLVISAILRIRKEGEKIMCSSEREKMFNIFGNLVDLNVNILCMNIHYYIKKAIICEHCQILIADRSSNELYCHVFDDKPIDTEFRAPINDCIIGKCMEYGKMIQISNVDKEADINPLYDFITNDHWPVNMVCLPLFSNFTNKQECSDVIAVLVIYSTDDVYGCGDDINLKPILRFASTMLSNVLGYQHEQALKTQTAALHKVAQKLFNTLDDRDKLLQSIMEEAKMLIGAEKFSLFFLNKEKTKLQSVVFDSKDEYLIDVNSSSIAGQAVLKERTYNIISAYEDPDFDRTIDTDTGFKSRNILCVPIFDASGIAGVTQLINKLDGPCFTACDVEIANMFSIYCGISIQQATLYREVQREQSRCRIAREMQLYQNMKIIPQNQIEELALCDIVDCLSFDTRATRFDYSPCDSLAPEMWHNTTELKTPKFVLSMVEEMGMIKKWKIPRKALANFVLMVKHGYRDLPYHNWQHALSVAHFCYLLYKHCASLSSHRYLSELEIMVLFVSCLCHDIDHRGTNNAFQDKLKSNLSILYGSEGSVMERHHLAMTLNILNTDGCNIFEHLSPDEYKQAIDLIRHNIIATDIVVHCNELCNISKMTSAGYDPESDAHRMLMCSVIMTSCDLSTCCKSWENTHKVSKLIYDEFYTQGDLEKALGGQPSQMMDRAQADFEKHQLNFMNAIAEPVYNILHKLFPDTAQVYEDFKSNRTKWEELQIQKSKESQ